MTSRIRGFMSATNPNRCTQAATMYCTCFGVGWECVVGLRVRGVESPWEGTLVVCGTGHPERLRHSRHTSRRRATVGGRGRGQSVIDPLLAEFCQTELRVSPQSVETSTMRRCHVRDT